MLPSPDALTRSNVVNTDGASTVALAAPGAGWSLYVTEITIVNSSGTPVNVDIQNGVGGAVRWTLFVPANGQSQQTFVNGLGGFSENTAVAFDSSAAVTSLTVSMNGFKRQVV